MNDFYTDTELKNLFGLRPQGIAIFEPIELGWVCPIDYHHEITWSEFDMHIWCYQCEKDYFTLLCPKRMNPFTTEEILRKETESVKQEMSEWTLERYRNYHNEESETCKNEI